MRELNTAGELHLFDDVLKDRTDINREILRQIIVVAVELAREGREGRKIGTMFILADSQKVLERSKCLILDPLWHHTREEKHIEDFNLRETIKELAQLDGAFVVDNDGVVLSAARYINASSAGIDLPLGLGSRHMAAASITKETEAIAVVVSESAIVRVFDDGEIVAEIIPELWLLRRFGLHMGAPFSTRTDKEITVVSKSN